MRGSIKNSFFLSFISFSVVKTNEMCFQCNSVSVAADSVDLRWMLDMTFSCTRQWYATRLCVNDNCPLQWKMEQSIEYKNTLKG